MSGALGHYLPVDRPVFYGLFMRIVSLQASLWLVIIVQGILTAYLMMETLEIFYVGNRRNIVFVVSIISLTLFTGISHTVSILLPDIFSPISILCLVNLLLNSKMSKFQLIFISFLLALSTLLHYSNWLAISLLYGLLLCYMFLKKVIKKQTVLFHKNRLLLCASLLLSFLVLAPSINYFFGKKFVISESSHVFLMNHLIETGILEEYLNNECARKNYKICEFKDHLDTNFIWSPNSAFSKLGGWYQTKDEFNGIIKDIVITPKYALLLARRCVEYSFMQYFSFDIPPFKNYPVPPFLRDYRYKIYGRDYCASLQYNSWLDFKLTSLLQRILVFISLGFLILVLFIKEYFQLSQQAKWLIILVMIYSFLNAAVCANFSTINLRFQDRIIWLIPFTAILVAANFFTRITGGTSKNA
jgi:hypothetical protein